MLVLKQIYSKKEVIDFLLSEGLSVEDIRKVKLPNWIQVVEHNVKAKNDYRFILQPMNDEGKVLWGDCVCIAKIVLDDESGYLIHFAWAYKRLTRR